MLTHDGKIIGLDGIVDELQMRVRGHLPVARGGTALEELADNGEARVVFAAVDVVAAFDVQELTLELVELLGVCAELRGAQRGKLTLEDLKVAGQTILLDCQRV